MPLPETHTGVIEYPQPKSGVNLYSSIVDLTPEECITAQNCIWRNGVVKRGGSTLFETDEVSTGKKITGLHRFYYGAGLKQLLVSSGTVVKYHDGATWQNVKTGLSDGQPTYFSTWINNAYIANGTDAPHKWTGSVSSTLSAAPANTTMFLPYQDRLLSITGGDLTWSGAFDDTTWGSVANIGVRPDTKLYGMIIHSATNVDAVYESKVLLAGANGMYVFTATDMRWPATTGDYTIFTLAGSVGCNAPRTMCWTPKGTIYLGIDRQVYLIPFDSLTPVPIGRKIRSSRTGVEGIEKITGNMLENACAVYHEGFYKLFFAQSGQTSNKVQFWLDVTRLHETSEGLVGPWYGPMLGQSNSCVMVQNGSGDESECLAGEDDATVGSYVYQIGRNDIYADNGTAIQIYYQTFYNPLSEAYLRKDIHEAEFEILDVLGTVNVDFLDITGLVKSGDLVNLSGNAEYWDDNYWGEEYWSSSLPTRVVLPITPAMQVRRLSFLIKHNTGNDKFELYAVRVKVTEQQHAFA